MHAGLLIDYVITHARMRVRLRHEQAHMSMVCVFLPGLQLWRHPNLAII